MFLQPRFNPKNHIFSPFLSTFSISWMFHFHASFAFYLWCLDPERREMSWRASGPGGSSKIPPLLPKVSLPSSELQAGLHGGLFGCKGSLTLRLAGGPPRLSLLHVLASLHVLAQIRSERALPRRCRVWASQGDLWRENILSTKDASSARVSVPSQHLICTHLHTLRLFFFNLQPQNHQQLKA